MPAAQDVHSAMTMIRQDHAGGVAGARIRQILETSR